MKTYHIAEGIWALEIEFDALDISRVIFVIDVKVIRKKVIT